MTRHLAKRSLSLAGHRTSVALEPEFWEALERIAHAGGDTLSGLVTRLDASRDPSRPLASALRLEALRRAPAGAGARGEAPPPRADPMAIAD